MRRPHNPPPFGAVEGAEVMVAMLRQKSVLNANGWDRGSRRRP